MTLKGGTSQACAACKYQRRRCLPECPLAAYFPADKPKMFQNVHRLFGVSNIVKILKQVDDKSLHGETMRSIIYESETREKFPVLGCYGVISQLYYQVQVLEEQLHAIRLQIEWCKMQQLTQEGQQHIGSSGRVVTQNGDDSFSQLQLGMAPPENNINNGIVSFGDQNEGLVSWNNNEQFWAGYGNAVMNNNNNSVPDGFGMISDHQQQLQQHFDEVGLQQQQEIVHHFEGMHPFSDGAQSSFVGSKIAFESSSSGSDESRSLKRQQIGARGHHVAESSCYLRNSGTCFSLDS